MLRGYRSSPVDTRFFDAKSNRKKGLYEDGPFFYRKTLASVIVWNLSMRGISYHTILTLDKGRSWISIYIEDSSLVSMIGSKIDDGSLVVLKLIKALTVWHLL